jgi:hypothetical protein
MAVIFNKTNTEQGTRVQCAKIAFDGSYVVTVADVEADAVVGSRRYAATKEAEALAYAEACYIGKPLPGDSIAV